MDGGISLAASSRFLLTAVAAGVSLAVMAVENLPYGAIRTWPQPKEMARSADFALTAGGRSVDVLATAKPQKRILEHLRHPYSFAMFESDGPVEVEVALALPFDCASLTTVVIDP